MVCSFLEHREVDKGKFANSDLFVDFQNLNKRCQLLLTDQRVMFCVKNDIFGGWQTEWTYRWPECQHSRTIERGIELLLCDKNRKVLGLFGSSEQQKKVIFIEQIARKKQLSNLMQAQITLANH